MVKSSPQRVLTDDVVLWTKRVHHSLVPVTSEPLDDDLHNDARSEDGTSHEEAESDFEPGTSSECSTARVQRSVTRDVIANGALTRGFAL